MPRASAHRDIIRIRHVFPHGFLRVENASVLIEIGELQPCSQDHLTAAWLKFSENQFKKRAFAWSIRADNADTITAQDACREIANDDIIVVTKAHLTHVDDELARWRAAIDAKPCASLRFQPLGFFPAHLLQGAYATLVARASGLYTLSDPGFLFRQFLIELCAGALLDFHELVFFSEISVEVAGEWRKLAAIELDNARGQAAYERPVVSNEHDRTVVIDQIFFEPRNRVDVEVIGRLVKKQKIGFAYQGACQHDLSPSTPGTIGQKFDVRQSQSGEYGFNFLINVPSVPSFYAGLKFGQALQGSLIGSCVGDLMVFG